MSTVNRGIITNGLVLCLDAANPNSIVSGSTVWNDLSKSANKGTLTNGPIYNSANGGSLLFDGNDDFVTLGNVLNFGLNSCTLNVWLKINSTWASGSLVLFSKALAGAQNYRYAFAVTQTLQLYAFVQGNGGTDITPTTVSTLNIGQWYMCTMVINRASNIQLYINGVLQTLSGDATISQWNNLDFQSINPLRIGSYTGGDNVSVVAPFKGNIAHTLMYFKGLSATEVLQNYNVTKSRFGL